MIQAIPAILLLISLIALILLFGTNSAKTKAFKETIADLESDKQESDKLIVKQQLEIDHLTSHIKEQIYINDTQKNFIAELLPATESLANKEQELAELARQAGEQSVDNDNKAKEISELTTSIQSFEEKYKGVFEVEKLIEHKNIEFKASVSALQELNEKYIQAYEIYKAIELETKLYQNDLEIAQFGLYKPQYDYFTSEEFKQKIELNYLKQRELIKIDKACICHTEWLVNGSKVEGRKQTNQNKKLMLFAFNGECDALIAKLRWNTATKSIERLRKSFDAINKLGSVANVNITQEYLNLKLAELALTHEYENKKQDEKEEQRRIRERMREEEKVVRELEQAQREAIEEEKRYQKALNRVKEDLKYASVEELEALNDKVLELELKLKEAEDKRVRSLSMAQQTKVGHIYIISNIGSFGEDVYKIGMTRRLEPLDRVRELSDAAVPFRYDVHAVIFSENAPQLEYDLHKHFNTKRINRVNGRKEFFKVSLEEIANYVKEHGDAEIEFTLMAEAKEYRETLSIIESILQLEEQIELSSTSKFPTSLID